MRQDKGITETLVSGSKAFTGNIALSEMGAEYLWGRRKNVGGDSGDATQLQVAVKYCL